ncbi:Geranylgeranyl pyrophosphate synthetase [Neofusicoccum parvum]|nr:Geranylgeranyl pyrophosphate synthetase [Neofusicoccum parvum]
MLCPTLVVCLILDQSKTITEKDLTASEKSNIGMPVITDCKYVGSYNWMDVGRTPTILVPGMPPAWTPLEEPKQLEEDAGQYYRDPNAAHYPEYPIEPAARAIFAHDASFSTNEADIFACGSTLGNLLRFVRKMDKPFRFTVEVVGNTVFFVRRENSPTEVIPGVRGYGHTFPEAYTTWEENTKGSQSHQRLVKYNFSGLNCIVRSESDGYLKDLDPDPSAHETSSLHPASPMETRLELQAGGRLVPQEALFDLKTRSVKRKDRDVLGEEVGRLWVSQTPNFILAYHDRGLFDDIVVQNIRKDIDKWEAENQDTLRQLAALVRQIAAIAKSRVDGRVEVRRKDIDVLEIREQMSDAPTALPDELKLRWAAAATEKPPDSSDDASIGDENDKQYLSSDEDFDRDDPWLGSDDESDRDYTACSADDCGYCGHCRY